MKIIHKKGMFHLPEDFSIELTRYNPLFNDEGEQSTPITLPGTVHNLKILGFPSEIGSYYKPISKTDVDVVDGVFARQARMEIHHASRQGGISCTLYFNDAKFYSEIEGKMMGDVPLDIINGVGATLSAQRADMVSKLKAEYNNASSTMYRVFPLRTGVEVKREVLFAEVGGEESIYFTETCELVINGFETFKAYDRDNVPVPYDIVLDEFQGDKSQTFIAGSDKVEVDVGYGMGGFVQLFYYLQKMFSHYGYNFDDSELRAKFEKNSSLVILHNVVDAIYDGYMKLSDLLPDMSIKDFIKEICVQFGGFFSFNDALSRVSFHFYDDVFDFEHIDIDAKLSLSKYMSSSIEIDETNFHNLTIISEDEADKVQQNAIIETFSVLKAERYKLKTNSFDEAPDAGYVLNFWNSRFFQIENIQHKYSQVISVDESSEEMEERKAEQGKLFVVGVLDAMSSAVQHYPHNVTVKFTVIYRNAEHFANNTFTPTLHSKRKVWMKRGDMRCSTSMMLSMPRLYNLDMLMKYEIDGTLFFIDSVGYKLPFDAKQDVRLRTFKLYEDSPPAP